MTDQTGAALPGVTIELAGASDERRITRGGPVVHHDCVSQHREVDQITS